MTTAGALTVVVVLSTVVLSGIAADASGKPTRIVYQWYKPHYQCGAAAGSTPGRAAAFINAQMAEAGGSDFVAVSEWAPTAPGVPAIGNPPLYGSTAAVCGYGSDAYFTPVVLFHRRDRWDRVAAYPPSDACADAVPLPSTADRAFLACANATAPGAGASCCSCTFSAEEYAQGDAWNQGTGQRPWTAGVYRDRGTGRSLCVVAAEWPHPLWYSELQNVDGVPTDPSRPQFSIARNICTSEYSADLCVPNLSGTSIVFGTDAFVRGVEDFCGDAPIAIAADTNAAMGDFGAANFFLTPPSRLEVSGAEHRHHLWPYTCCNDTASGGGLNRYASDRIMLVDGGTERLRLEQVEGGSAAPGGALPDGLGFQCASPEEHAPYRAYFELS